jgi:preprotein translocase subunit SecF
MEFFKGKTTFDFMGKSRIAAVFSAVLLVASFTSFAVRGLNLGIDFTGGVLVEVGFATPPDLAVVRAELEANGFPSVQVQNFGTARDVLIRLPPLDDANGGKVGNQIIEVLRTNSPDVQLRRVEFVGPQVGKDLTEQGTLAVLSALALILVYIMVRFQWKFAVGAIVAALHDPIITVGVFSEFGIQFDLSVLAGVLAILGYSLNDTIVIFDRIRENMRRARKGEVADIMNTSINETLSRTLMTHGMTSTVVVALLLLGGESLHGFSIALAVGIIVGTYSSIYIASATAMWLKVSTADLMPVKKEAQVDEMP